jgi:signal peptidase I
LTAGGPPGSTSAGATPNAPLAALSGTDVRAGNGQTAADGKALVEADKAGPGASDLEDSRRARRRRRRKNGAQPSFLKELPFLLVLGFGIVVLLKSFVIGAFYIPSGSMEETLQINDRVLVFRQAYTIGEPKRGDIVVFRSWDDAAADGADVPSPGMWGYIVQSLKEGIGLKRTCKDPLASCEDLIKRVIGLPGETVEVKDSYAYINGKKLDEPYVYIDGPDALADFGPITVPEGKYFVMGDHRNNSSDSRARYLVDVDAIVGKAFIRIWPLGRFGSVDG